MNVTNDYDPPAYLVHEAKRKGRRFEMATFYAARQAPDLLDAGATEGSVRRLCGQASISAGILTFEDGSSLDLASLVRERDELRSRVSPFAIEPEPSNDAAVNAESAPAAAVEPEHLENVDIQGAALDR